MLMIYILLASFFYISCLVKKSKIIMFLQFLWCWLLYGLNTGGADYIGNESIYYYDKCYSYNSIDINTTWFAKLLYSICNNLNLSYIEFNVITGLVAFGVLFFVIWKMSKTPNIVYGMLMVYPMTEFIIQKRFFLSVSVIILGIYLFSVIDNKMKKNIALLLCIILACGLHFSSVFYITLFYMNIDENRGFKYKLRVWILVSICFLSLSFISIKIGLISQSKIINYMKGETSHISLYKIPYFIFLQCLLYCITITLYKMKKVVSQMEKYFSSYSTVLLCLLPTYIFNTIFRRFYIHLFPLNYLIIADYYKVSFKKRALYTYIMLVANIMMIVYLAFIETRFLGDIGFDKLIVDLYRYNLLFKYIII